LGRLSDAFSIICEIRDDQSKLANQNRSS